VAVAHGANGASPGLEAKVRPVIGVDDAQHLRRDVLGELRLLAHDEMDSQGRLCLLLVGHAELRRRIGMAVHAPLCQRIVGRYHLDGLGRDEVAAYLAHLPSACETLRKLPSPERRRQAGCLKRTA
jgi:type II secretory pathway predicted ATPase ExeA